MREYVWGEVKHLDDMVVLLAFLPSYFPKWCRQGNLHNYFNIFIRQFSYTENIGDDWPQA
jgi:hypothetical protein